ncbi:MAG: Eco57I restriction-modification methylase domain-containing protein [Deltaproteobacteria bacterium]|nr:Eco57I restriction-modification methylase domain-containing protein [Deltaproteobacteria bacterium]
MDNAQAKNIIKKTFEAPFDKERFIYFIKNFLNKIDETKAFSINSEYIKDMFKSVINSYERIATYTAPDDQKIDILIVNLQKNHSLDHARTAQRNFAGNYLKNRGEKDAGLFAFVPPDKKDWRFSLVTIDYEFKETKAKETFTPAKRYSFLVGENEASHTAQSRLVKIFAQDQSNPSLADLEEAFNIEKVTEEFFLQYRKLFLQVKEALDKIAKQNPNIKAEFDKKKVDTVNFAKKLLGQIIFLYFLQKKGWFGVELGEKWGTGSKRFLRDIFEKKHKKNYDNFFNDILEPLFYEAIRTDRSHDDHYYKLFDCKIPFLNGGLFDPIYDYDWVNTDINLPDSLFSNKNEDNQGSGILDIFDLYNFTVQEDQPLEKEVAIDPELLGKAYEKFNAVRRDNFEEFKQALKSGKKGDENKFNKKFGVYYTPREIVHYMCRQSLINYIYAEANKAKLIPPLKKQEIKILIEQGEFISENEVVAAEKQEKIKKGEQQTSSYNFKLSQSVRDNSKAIDKLLQNIKVCDPAVGSGAFPVGMMNEIVAARKVLALSVKKKALSDYNLKRQCIERSLYGADIDSGAVEIAKLRLWLSLIVDEQDIKNIKPLPNLDYKIVCGNSLLGLKKDLLNYKLFEEMEQLKDKFFNETNPTKKDEDKNKINNLIKQISGEDKEFDFKLYFSEVFREKKGFDIVIANPPYVSTKGREETDKKALKKVYEFVDDLYNHFYFKAVEIANNNKGIIAFISSKTFWTIQTKHNLRNLLLNNRIIELYDTASPFEAMVDTCIAIFQKDAAKDYTLTVKDGKKNLLNPKTYKLDGNIYKNASNNVFFIPDNFNIAVYNKYNSYVKKLMNKWWDNIKTSRKIKQCKTELDKYRKLLKPGDITLLGLITEGGQGLATANNGKYIGVLDKTKGAENIKKTRPQKLLQAVLSQNIAELNLIKTKRDAQDYLETLNEFKERKLFDSLKEKYGRDIFGQGYLYKIVSKNEIADVNSLSDKEKKKGICGNKTFVPYDKGDKYGNRWYLKTPYYINWSKENVKYLYDNSGKKGIGMPVVRNPDYYFREGFCWTDVNSTYLKSRIKENGVYDVLSMSLFSMLNAVPSWYIVSLINSQLISEYVDNFINSTSHFQINDARQLPIIIPNEKQLQNFEVIFNQAYETKKKEFSKHITNKEAEKLLEDIQKKIDKMVYKLYRLTEQEIKIIKLAK